MSNHAPGKNRSIVIDGMPFFLLRDHDSENLPKLTFDGKTKWLEARANRVLFEPYKLALERWEQDQLGLILVTGLCAGISASASFLSPDERDRRAFLIFVKKYMPDSLAQKPGVSMSCDGSGACCWGRWLYSCVRCGLAHGFTISRGGFDLGLSQLIDDVQPFEPMVDAKLLWSEFKHGWDNYLAEVRSARESSELGKNFVKRWDELFVGGSKCKKQDRNDEPCPLCAS